VATPARRRQRQLAPPNNTDRLLHLRTLDDTGGDAVAGLV